jgi:predicted nuclease of predicted toxin-antitoxin system
VNLLAYESVDGDIVRELRADGHEVLYVAEMSPGLSDEDVLQQANGRGATLLTSERDFGELVFRQGFAESGVVLLRLAGLTQERKAAITAAVLRTHGEALRNCFTVVSKGSIRMRIRRRPDASL